MENVKIFEKYFRSYCDEDDLNINLSFDMPMGCETANGTFDPTVKTVFLNAEMLKDYPEYEQLFYLFHELRHASQYMHPERFSDLIAKSRLYAVMYDGTCYKLIDGEWKTCRLEGTVEYFTEMYLGQPYERDANDFAFERVKALVGDAPGLRELYAFWMPKRKVTDEMYEALYDKIDQRF